MLILCVFKTAGLMVLSLISEVDSVEVHIISFSNLWL